MRTKDTGLATVYIFDGQRIIGEYSDGAPSAVYTWGADGVVSRRILSSGVTRWYHYGPHGETRHLTDGSGSITDSYTYTAYGVPLSSSGSSVNPFRYGGKFGYFYDGFTGVLRAGERWYAPHLMRWLSRDPILFDGGYNVYEYVGGRVTSYVDPTGLQAYFHNGSDKPVKYKHSDRWANRKLECPAGVTCTIDGIYFDGWDRPPVKVYDNCSCATKDGRGLSGLACPRWQTYLGYTAHPYDWRKEKNREDWDPEYPIMDSQDSDWKANKSPMP